MQEVTWRATKLRTKNGQFLIVPNSVISKDAILNYSEPTIPTRLEVEVGASYLTPPNEVKQAIHRAMANAPLVLQRSGSGGDGQGLWRVVGGFTPPSSGSRITRATIRRRIRCAPTSGTSSAARTSRSRIRSRSSIRGRSSRCAWTRISTPRPRSCRRSICSRRSRRKRRRGLARAAGEHLFAAGEAIVRQGDRGSSMFVVLRGNVMVTLEPSGQQVATITSGGFFGEMSMLTGDPRTATVRAVDDVQVLEIAAADMRRARAVHARVAGAHQQGRFGSPRRPGASRSHRRSCRRGTDAGAADPTCANPGLPATLRSSAVGDLAMSFDPHHPIARSDRQLTRSTDLQIYSTHSKTSFPSRVTSTMMPGP